MARSQKEPKSLSDLRDAINNLEIGIRSYNSGQISAYKIVAVQLRILLCDSHKGRDTSLLPRVFKGIRLHPLFGGITREQDEYWKRSFGHAITDGLVFMTPGIVHLDGKGGSRIEVLFDENREPIDLAEWLDQMLFSKEITIRELIKSVADKEATHSDDDYGSTLVKTKSVRLPDEDVGTKFLVAIAEYLLKTFKPLVAQL